MVISSSPTLLASIVIVSCWSTVSGFAPFLPGLPPAAVQPLRKIRANPSWRCPDSSIICHATNSRAPREDFMLPYANMSWALTPDQIDAFYVPREGGNWDVEGLLPEGRQFSTETLVYGAGAMLVATLASVLYATGLTPHDVVDFLQRLLASPQETLQDVVAYVQAMGPLGVVYFGIIYLLAEILAVPATPLALSAGYLFGLTQGVTVVLIAATMAATVGFFVGKTFLRNWVEGILEENQELAKIDKAIGKEGFKLLFLLRLSPLFPFSLSNYVYGASSIEFAPYFWATLLGFAPGTVAYVYTGMIGQTLTLGEVSQPWYFYVGGAAMLGAALKVVTDVASKCVHEVEEEY